MSPDRDDDRGSVLENRRFLVIILAAAVVVGGALWLVIANPDRVAGWFAPDEKERRVEKPTVRPTAN